MVVWCLLRDGGGFFLLYFGRFCPFTGVLVGILGPGLSFFEGCIGVMEGGVRVKVYY